MLTSRKATQPYRALAPMDWASHLIADSHREALLAFGEFCLFTLMWRPVDFAAGLVGHCATCFVGVTARQADAFQQPNKRECPDCFGTTYEGGYRAQIIRPALLTDRNQEINEESRGVVTTDKIMVESTADFVFHKGDYLFRYDNTRFQCEEMSESVLRTGFAPPQRDESFSGATSAQREETTSVAFRIPPLSDEGIESILSVQGTFTATNLATFPDIIRTNGYLLDGIPVAATDDQSVSGGDAGSTGTGTFDGGTPQDPGTGSTNGGTETTDTTIQPDGGSPTDSGTGTYSGGLP